MSPSQLQLLASASYFVAATLFLLGLQRMASPRTARSGIQWAGVGMVLATLATLLLPGLQNIGLILLALVLGVASTWLWGRKVAITDMPQMVALYNGMGGGSAAAIGAVELLRYSEEGRAPSTVTLVLAVLMHTGPLEGKRFADVSENAVYWYFVVLSWLPIYLVIYWAPRLSG